jgi:3-deoxy-D-manno-octulosonate 8-phosphate phosphatase (KDO 8-P phosphatase)
MPCLRESFIFMTCSRQGWCRGSVVCGQKSVHGIQMRKTKTSVQAKAKKIKLLLLDVDGVLTDGRITLDNRGNELKAFHVRDGHGIKMAQRAGIIVGIITGRKAEVVNIRARELGIQEVHQGTHEKITVYDSILAKYRLRDEAVAYMGDDVVDLEIFQRSGFAVTVADADPSVKPYVDIITKTAGGRGAVRELINLILKHQGKLHSS